MTLIRAIRRDGGGRIVFDRRCDGRCHNQKSASSRCICGGALSGLGEHAEAYLRDHWEIVDQVRARFPNCAISVPDEVRQIVAWGKAC